MTQLLVDQHTLNRKDLVFRVSSPTTLYYDLLTRYRSLISLNLRCNRHT